MNEKVIKTVKESGHKLTFKVRDLLVDNGWDVNISPKYLDDSTGKIREIDIIADFDQRFKIPRKNGAEYIFTTRLVIETKYIKEPLILFTEKNNINENENLMNRIAYSVSDGDIDLISEFSFYSHRYFIEDLPLAILSSSVDNKDIFYDATNTVIKSVSFDIEKNYKNLLAKRIVIYYPIVITEGSDIFYLDSTVNLKKDKLIDKALNQTQHIIGKINYLQKIKFETPADYWDYNSYYIDLIQFSKLEKLIDRVMTESSFYGNRLKNLKEINIAE